MSALLKLLQFLFQIIPLVHQVVQAVEVIVPGAKQGAAKLDAATNILSGILPTIGATLEQVQQLRAPLQATISAVVDVANKNGTIYAEREQPGL